ncbi:hypothetical protein MY11210_008507 [Beauveria gryllotalpidicola]
MIKRTLDIFYLAQLGGYGYYHQADLEDGGDYFANHFDDYYAKSGELLTEDV